MFGDLLRARRTARGATQRQLADLSTVSVRAIRDLESGRAQRPRRETVRLIADGLGLRGRERTDFEAAAGTAGGSLGPAPDAGWPPLPVPLDVLEGRNVERAAVADLLSGGDRLVTVTGLAGIGKSRLAVAVAADRQEAGVPVLWSRAGDAGPEPDRAAAAVLRALGGPEVLAGPGVPAVLADPGALAAELGGQRALLVLDGHRPGRHLQEGIVALLRECRGLAVLASGQVPFGLPGERVFPLPPLAVPEPAADHDPAALAAGPSVRLLVRHIRQVRPEFSLDRDSAPAVAALCRRLDGIPAALVAVARWFLVYSPDEVAALVGDDPFDLTADHSPGLREALDRAIGDLDDRETSALARLAGLEGGWSMSDAAGITGVPVAACAQLVRHLLLRGLVRPTGQPGRTRFRALRLVSACTLERPLHPAV